jgi:deoxyadenosine/deoxycytidine kinase
MRIVISGTVGVGKTTTSKNLKQRLVKKFDDVDFLLELPEDNPYLALYYHNRPEWSFLIQMDFLMARYRNLLEETERQNAHPGRVAIFDRHFLDDIVFAKLNSVQADMSAFQYAQYKNTNDELASKIKPEDQPDYFILLKASYDEVINRIHSRGRDSEQEVDEDY